MTMSMSKLLLYFYFCVCLLLLLHLVGIANLLSFNKVQAAGFSQNIQSKICKVK